MCPWNEGVLAQGEGSSLGEQGWRSWRGGEEAGLGKCTEARARS